MDHPTPTSRVLHKGVCSHIRHKGMYVMSEHDPAYFDPYAGTAYWCCCTQTSFGPDGDPVRPDTCDKERACCD